MMRFLAGGFVALALSSTALADAVIEGFSGIAHVGANQVAVGQRIPDGSNITTEANSSVALGFDDGQKMVVGASSHFRLVSFRYQGRTPAGDHAVFDLLKGSLRVVTGALAARSKELWSLRTPEVMIGVRGTDFIVALANGSHVNVLSGQVALTNGAGTAVFGPGSIASAATNGVLAAPATSVPTAASSAFQSMGSATLTAGGAAGGAAGVAGTAGTGIGFAAPAIAVGIGVGAAAVAESLRDEEDPVSSSTTHH